MAVPRFRTSFQASKLAGLPYYAILDVKHAGLVKGAMFDSHREACRGYLGAETSEPLEFHLIKRLISCPEACGYHMMRPCRMCREKGGILENPLGLGFNGTIKCTSHPANCQLWDLG